MYEDYAWLRQVSGKFGVNYSSIAGLECLDNGLNGHLRNLESGAVQWSPSIPTILPELRHFIWSACVFCIIHPHCTVPELALPFKIVSGVFDRTVYDSTPTKPNLISND